MNKNVKKIVAMALAVGTISAAAPATQGNLLITKAYASSDNDGELTGLKLTDDNDDDVDLYEDSSYDDDLNEDNLDDVSTVYAKASGDHVNLDIDGPSNSYVKVFYENDDHDYDEDDGQAVGDDIDLNDSDTTVVIRIYDENVSSDDISYDDDYESQYKVKIKYDDSDSSDNENDEDTLDSLELVNSNDDDIQLYSSKNYGSSDKIDNGEVAKSKTYYAKTSSNKVSINTDGPDDNYVKIFSSTSSSSKGVDPGDSISVSANKTLTVRIYSEEPDSDVTYGDDDNVIGKYTIQLEYTGTGSTGSTTTAGSNPSSATDVSSVKNKWVQVNGKWQYKDATGNPVKNTWMGNYFLQYDGNMATGWLNYAGRWYYLGTDGAKKSGWQAVGGIWYYLDSQGSMQTGWIRDIDGKWYYLFTNGAMAYSTTIDGYRLGSNGAWVK